MIDIDKSLVKKQFNCGLNTYSKEAVIQKQIAQRLITALKSKGLYNHSRLFEVGCGTGFLTQKIIESFNLDEYMVNDISSTAKLKIRELNTNYSRSIEFLEGDAEEIDFPQNLNAVISSSTIQWFNDKQVFFEKVYQSLQTDGILAFSTFGCDNFKEIRNLTGVGLEYQCLYEITEMLSEKFNIIMSEEWIKTKEFDAPIDVLRHIKQTGVNGIQKTYFGKQQLNDFINGYHKQFSTHTGSVSLTYNPIIIIAQKK